MREPTADLTRARSERAGRLCLTGGTLASVQRPQSRIDGIQKLGARRIEALREQDQCRQRRNALTCFNCAHVGARERLPNGGLRKPELEAAPADLHSEPPRGVRV